MAECIYDLDRPEDLPKSPELVKFLCSEFNKPPPEVQDPLKTFDLGTKDMSKAYTDQWPTRSGRSGKDSKLFARVQRLFCLALH
ncbi:hypothetical protein ACFX12_014298 [Malus domestica]